MDTEKHFHIRWANGTLDWEGHDSREEAQESARRLAQRDEGYVIEEHQGASAKCSAGPYGETSATA